MTAKNETSPKHLSIRGVDPALAKALSDERKRLGMSLNQTVLDLLRQVLGLGTSNMEYDNGLGRFAGTWTEAQFREFERNTASFGDIDEDLWKC